MILEAILLTSWLFGGEKVVINEFAYDDSSTDDKEFVEIYNPTSAPIDISGWKLGGNDPSGSNAEYTVPASTILAAGDYYVFGSALVPNVDQVVGTTNLWENSQESLELYDGDGNLIDSVGYEANKGLWPGAAVEGEGVWGNMTNVDGVETSWSRMRDGMDTNNNRDFRLQPWSPGASNNLPATAHSDDFDARTVGDTLPDFGASFVLPHVVDPTVVDAQNPNAIAASPQGGKAAIFWDASGGGNSNMLLRDGSCDVVVEAWVYFDAALELTGEIETWSLGVQGTTGTFYNSPDPSGSLGFTANGNTGVSWTYQTTDAGATLYLVDHNDGGNGAAAKTDAIVIGSVVLSTGVNDGWQRLRLEISASSVTGYFGGTFGGTDGTKVTGTLSAPAEGGVYVGYREGLASTATARPFTCDRLEVSATASTGIVDTSILTAKSSTVSTPRVGTNGCPQIGNASFAITGVGLVPSGSSYMVLGFVSTPIDLGALGGQSGSFIYVDPGAIFGVASDANGDASLPAAIPNTAAFKGVTFDVQIIDVDPSLALPVQLANSRVMNLTIG